MDTQGLLCLSCTFSSAAGRHLLAEGPSALLHPKLHVFNQARRDFLFYFFLSTLIPMGKRLNQPQTPNYMFTGLCPKNLSERTHRLSQNCFSYHDSPVPRVRLKKLLTDGTYL